MKRGYSLAKDHMDPPKPRRVVDVVEDEWSFTGQFSGSMVSWRESHLLVRGRSTDTEDPGSGTAAAPPATGVRNSGHFVL